MSKNVAVFVDVANIFYAAKAAGVDIDYVTLLKSATAGRDLVRAYAYTGLDPENENQRNFHSFLARHGYKVVSKDIRKYGDGKVKANLDIELVIDMMKTARNLDIAIVVSGDGDFAPAIRAVQEMGVRVEVISFRGNTSSDLIDVADQFTEIIQLARVEKASSRSGRRVAGDDEDLSMTEVPDKQTEGSGTGRGRGRGRRAAAGREAEPAASRAGRRIAEPATVVTSSGASLVVLPGEKLSKVIPAAVVEPAAGVEDDDAAAEADSRLAAVGAAEQGGDAETGGRRRRRRGGRGRGRGRQRGEAGDQRPHVEPEIVGDDEEFVEAPRAPRSTPFGSVWDSQLGVPSAAPSPGAPIGQDDEEDFDEPAIPEYLIAERRNRGRGPVGGAGRGRGNRSAYAAAMERERFGGGRSGGINRYPDVGDRGRGPQPGSVPGGFPRRDRPERPDRERRERGDRDRFERQPRTGDEPWSEVPPELEAMLRAQVASRPRPESPARDASDGRGAPRTELTADAVAVPIEVSPPAEPVAEPTVVEEVPKRRTTRRATKAAEADDKPEADAPKRRTTARKTAPKAADDAEKPKRRTTRRKASEPQADEAATAADAGTQ